MRVSKAEQGLNYVILIAFSIFAVAPIVTIFLTALGPQLGVTTGGLHWENFATAWGQGNFGDALTRSITVAVFVVSVSLVLSILTGYAFGTMRFRGATILFYLFLLGLMIPAEAVVIPLFYDFQAAGMTDTIWAVSLPQIAQSTAFGTFWMRTQFRAMPSNLLEAAAIDGSTSWRALWRIAVPPTLPAIATVSVLMFMWTWNEFLIPLVMSPYKAWATAPLALNVFQGQYTADGALMSAAGVIIAAPIIVAFIFFQRYFINGMLEGATKG